MEPNISPWRRAVCGDLTSAFNFANPNNEPFPELPDTSQADAIVASQIKLPKPKPPAVAAMPKQGNGHPSGPRLAPTSWACMRATAAAEMR